MVQWILIGIDVKGTGGGGGGGGVGERERENAIFVTSQWAFVERKDYFKVVFGAFKHRSAV